MAQSTISINPDYQQKINKLCERFGMSKVKLVHSMIDYFEYYQINPNEREVNLDSKFAEFDRKLNKVRDTFVSFQRELEKKKLEPLIAQTNENTQALLRYLKEDAPTKEDLRGLSYGAGAKKVAFLENQPKTAQEPMKRREEPNSEGDSPLDEYKNKANAIIKQYNSYFEEMIKSASRKNDRGDYILVSAINTFKEKVQAIPKLNYEGETNTDVYDLLDKVETVLRTIDNYCDEFISKGQAGAGGEKFFYLTTINEYSSKFKNIKVY